MPETPNHLPSLEHERESLFNLLTEELNDLNEADKLHGATPWILSASLISIVWLIVQDLWKEPLHQNTVHSVFVFVALTLSGVVLIKGFFDSLTPGHLGRRPFTHLHSTESYLGAFGKMLWLGLLAYSVWTLPIPISAYLRVPLAFFYAVLALFSFVVMAIMAARLPLPTKSKADGFASLGVFLLLVLKIWMLTAIINSGVLGEATVGDLRVGGLIAVGAYAIILLSRTVPTGTSKRKILTDLRRDLVLGSISFEEIRNNARINLEGLGTSDVVHDDMSFLLNQISEVRSIYDDAFRKIDALIVGIPLDANLNPVLTEVQKVTLANTLDLLEIHFTQAGNIAKRYHKRLRRTQTRLLIFSKLTKSAADDGTKLMTEIGRAQVPADEGLKKFTEQFNEIQRSWNEWFPDERREFSPLLAFRS